MSLEYYLFCRKRYDNIINFLHLWTFKTPIFMALKNKKCKINFDGLTFSSSLFPSGLKK